MKPDPTKVCDPTSVPDAPIPRIGFAGLVLAWSSRHPVAAIVLVSLIAGVINCYPIIFCGRSFVSPAYVGREGALVYDWWPPAPGMRASILPVERHGSDTWATMLWAVPAGFIESRSLPEQGELPWWDRYSLAGDTFLGQAVARLGDPLPFMVILGRGSALEQPSEGTRASP